MPAELIQTFLEITSEVIWHYDFKKKKYRWFASRDNEEKFGFPVNNDPEFWTRNLHEDDLLTATTAFNEALANNQLTEFTHTYHFYGTGRIPYLIQDKIKIVRGDDGCPRIVLGVWRDITAEMKHQEHLERSLESQVRLNQELEQRQEILRLTQEELRQSNDQLIANYQQLSEREFILTQSQRLAKIGSWEYEYATGRFYWSDEIYKIYGVDKTLDPNDVELIKSLYYGDSRESFVHLYEEIITGTSQGFDVSAQIVTPLGYKKWVRLAGYGSDHLKSDRMIGVVYDITYFKEAEAMLRSSEEKFSKAFNSCPDPMLIVRRSDGVIIDANNKTGPLLGYSSKDLVGQTLYSTGNFRSDDDVAHILSSNPSEEAEFDCTLAAGDGTMLYVLISRSTVYFEDVANYILVIKDITARRVAEEKLRISEANLRATMNNTNVMVWSVDREMRYVMMNAAFLNYIRETYQQELREGMQAMPIDENDAEAVATRNKWIEFYKRALIGETFSLTEERFGRQLSYSLTPVIENGKVVGVSVFAEDISERIQNQRELADAQRSLAEYKLMALRSVMNPHFIFNALNSIQYFITKNDRLNAINYLSTFSKLIRGILTNSKHKTIKLSDEIELLKHYIQLEMVRFENKFEFVMEVDSDIDVDNIEVQSLIVQPFVENAILHGLYNSTRKGILKIAVKEDSSDGIVFIIEDNGIGRKAALELRKKTHPAHQSFGISLTEERLRLFNNNKDVSAEIEDLFDEDGPAGTRVKIRVKV